MQVRAYNYAARQHAGQFRKGASGDPYINHVSEVATLVKEATGGTDENLLAAALLHDVIEDSDATHETIADLFGHDVAGLVAELTDEEGLTETARRQAQIDHAPHLSKRAKIIKVADKISNILEMRRDPPSDWSIEKRLAYLEWGEAVFEGLKGVNEELDRQFLAATRDLRLI